MLRTPAPLFVLLAACNAQPLAQPHPMPEQQTDKYVEINVSRKADILFVVDDSLSMEKEQENLGRNFPAFIEVLRGIKGGLPDLHIGVVTSDLGAGPGPESGCRVGGLQGILQGWERACGLRPDQKFIAVSEGEQTRNYDGDLARVFGCMANVGIRGCGYEHQLAATTKALSVQRTPENAGFLREDAFLQIIVITDEDDCSAPPESDLFTRAFPEEEPSFRCARVGHLCRGQMPPAADFQAPLGECRPVENGDLIAVASFVEEVRALKASPDKILVSGIFGWPTGGAAGEYRVGRAPAELARTGKWDYLPACESDNGSAAAALRVKQFVEAFGANGFFESICVGDFRPALEKIAHKLALLVDPDLCVEAPLVDLDPAAAGIQPDCVVSERAPALGGYDETYLPPCSTAGADRACWRLEPNDRCGAHAQVFIDRKGQDLEPETRVAIKCRTCVRPDDERCRR
jgi:hypothetical protein